MIQRLLIRRVCLLKILHHQEAMAQATPDFAIGLINFQHCLKVIDSSWKVLFDSQNVGDGIKRLDGLVIMSQCLLVCIQSLIRISL